MTQKIQMGRSSENAIWRKRRVRAEPQKSNRDERSRRQNCALFARWSHICRTFALSAWWHIALGQLSRSRALRALIALAHLCHQPVTDGQRVWSCRADQVCSLFFFITFFISTLVFLKKKKNRLRLHALSQLALSLVALRRHCVLRSRHRTRAAAVSPTR